MPLLQVLEIYDLKAIWEWPPINSLWYHFVFYVPNKLLFMIYGFFFHMIPGYLIDALLICCGKKPL